MTQHENKLNNNQSTLCTSAHVILSPVNATTIPVMYLERINILDLNLKTPHSIYEQLSMQNTQCGIIPKVGSYKKVGAE